MLLLFIREVSYAFTSLWSNFIYHSRSLLAKITEKFLPKNTTATDKHNTVEVVQELEDDRASHSSKLKVETYNAQEAILDLGQNQLEVISGPQDISVDSQQLEKRAVEGESIKERLQFRWEAEQEVRSAERETAREREDARREAHRAERRARWEAEQEVRTAARETAREREDALREAHRAEEQARWEAGPGVQASEWEIALERLRARWEVEEAASQAGLEAELEVQAAELETAREREDALREAHRAEEQARWEAEQEVRAAERETDLERFKARLKVEAAERQARREAEQEVQAAERETDLERFKARLKVEAAERQARREAEQEVQAAEREIAIEREDALREAHRAERRARWEARMEEIREQIERTDAQFRLEMKLLRQEVEKMQAAERARKLEQKRAAEPYTKAVLPLIDNFVNRLALVRTRQPVIRKHGVLFFPSAPAARVTPPAPLTKSFVLEVISSTKMNPVITKPVTVPQDNVPEALSQQPHSYFPPEGTLAPLRKSELGVKVELPDGTILTVDTRSLPSARLGDVAPIKNKPYIIEIAKQSLIVVSKGPDQDHQPSL
jgi:hypothetical protein